MLQPDFNMSKANAFPQNNFLIEPEGDYYKSAHLQISKQQSNVANPYNAAKKRYLAELEQQRQ